MSETNETPQTQALQEEGYLMAYDKKAKKAKGVTGIDAEGNLKMEEPTDENQRQFMKVDKSGNILSNFGKNFLYQYNNPTGFLLYNISDTTKPAEAATQIETALQSQDDTVRKSLNHPRIYNDHHFNEREVDWEQAERYGITREGLGPRDKERMLQGKMSAGAYHITKESELGRDKGDAKLALFRDELGKVKFDLHFINQQLKVGDEFRGYKLTEEDIRNLNATGNLGHTPELVVDYSTRTSKPCYVSMDPVTHELFHMSKDRAILARQVKDHTFTKEEFEDYAAGREVGPITFTSANGKPCTTCVQISAAERGLEFLFERSTKLTQAQREGMAEERRSRQSQANNQRQKRGNSFKPR